MAESLREKIEQVIWGEEKDVFVPVRVLVMEELRRRILPMIIWELQAWALSKAEEHSQTHVKIDQIILAVRRNVADQEYHLSLQKLSKHHKDISLRYSTAADACKD